MRRSWFLAAFAALWSCAASAQTPSFLIQGETIARASSWTGPWVGAFVGGGVHQQSVAGEFAGLTYQNRELPSAAMFIGGAELGYDYQFQRVVVGVNGAVYASTAKRSGLFVDAGLRAGFLATPTFLLYATAGLSSGRHRSFLEVGGLAGGFGPFFIDAPSSQRLGYFVGAGAEFRLSEHWSVAFEYRYANYGLDRFTGLTPSIFVPATIEQHSRHHTTRFSARYRF
jgi:outer membrane immunogenic protein